MASVRYIPKYKPSELQQLYNQCNEILDVVESRLDYGDEWLMNYVCREIEKDN